MPVFFPHFLFWPQHNTWNCYEASIFDFFLIPIFPFGWFSDFWQLFYAKCHILQKLVNVFYIATSQISQHLFCIYGRNINMSVIGLLFTHHREKNKKGNIFQTSQGNKMLWFYYVLLVTRQKQRFSLLVLEKMILFSNCLVLCNTL